VRGGCQPDSQPLGNQPQRERKQKDRKLSISNIVAVALLSGSPHCPPVNDTIIVAEARPAPTQILVQPPIPVLAGPDEPSFVTVTGTIPSTATVTAPPQIPEATTNALPESVPLPDAADPAKIATPPYPATSAGGNDDTIIVTARLGAPPGDPMELVNEVTFGAVQSVDKAIIAPVAHGYEKGIPEPIRDGLHNVLNNLDEPVVFLNFLLQLKVGKAFETVGRFAINSTLGAAGLFDVAKKKPFGLPRRSNGLADTLGYYGVGPGPYMFLPLIGSTSVRDLFGRVVDLSLLPTAVGKPFTNPIVSLSKGALSSIDERVENDEILTRVQQSDNPYAAMREYYLKKRQAEIEVLKGKRCNADIDLNEIEALKQPGTSLVTPAPSN
jgi:phospholipid-binding lipoprotein MlaA